jgi:hypothetical protein
MRALSRQSRDLIAMTIKCFSAHTYFINSKIINTISKEGQTLYGSANCGIGCGASMDEHEQQETSISEVLAELEFVKKELYDQINTGRKQNIEKQTLRE